MFVDDMECDHALHLVLQVLPDEHRLKSHIQVALYSLRYKYKPHISARSLSDTANKFVENSHQSVAIGSFQVHARGAALHCYQMGSMS